MRQFGGKNAKKKTSSSSTKRHFTVVIGSKEHGLYVSSSPSSAARKAVSKLCATDKKRKVKFSIREITQGSKKKTYGPYLGSIEKLDKPIELKGRVIKYKPVAKLSGKSIKKSVVKKGGMRGGERCRNIYMNFPVTTDCWFVITNNLGLFTPQVLDIMTIFKMTIQQFCDFSEIKTILNLDQFFLRNFDEVSKFLIRESKKIYKNNDDCEIKEYGLTPETILFICIRKFYTELLVNIKTKGFIQEGNSKIYILPNSS
jgi:hypothetical protein